MVASFNTLTEHMRDLRAKPTGKLRVQMLPGFAVGHFGRMLAEFTEQYPDIEIDIVVNDRVVDPIEEGFDVAFQMFPPQAETLIERMLKRLVRARARRTPWGVVALLGLAGLLMLMWWAPRAPVAPHDPPDVAAPAPADDAPAEWAPQPPTIEEAKPQEDRPKDEQRPRRRRPRKEQQQLAEPPTHQGIVIN